MLLAAAGTFRTPLSVAAPALSAEAFAQAMAAFAPFEPAPHLAVGVSGGADSLALCLLARDWAQGSGGRVTALTVDHGLRAESAAEAARLGAWLGPLGIEHRILVWEGAKPRTGIQEAARTARRSLLGGWCREAGVLHLLLAHHRQDQDETLRLRRERKSGCTGLAAMAAVVESDWGRVLRPLLGVPPERLKGVLLARGQPWIEDPSNRNPEFARARLRARGDAGGDGAAEARAYGIARADRDRAVADLLARSVVLSPAGYCRLALEPLKEAAPALSRLAVERILMTVSGRVYPPRGARLDRLLQALTAGGLGRGRTLAGCRLMPRRGGVLVLREPAAVAGPVAAVPGHPVLWDGRFAILLKDCSSFPAGTGGRFWIAALGSAGYAEVCRRQPALSALEMPRLAAETLPAVWDLDGVAAVPHLTYGRLAADPDSVNVVGVAFRPAHPLAGAGFGVYLPNDGLDGGTAGW